MFVLDTGQLIREVLICLDLFFNHFEHAAVARVPLPHLVHSDVALIRCRHIKKYEKRLEHFGVGETCHLAGVKHTDLVKGDTVALVESESQLGCQVFDAGHVRRIELELVLCVASVGLLGQEKLLRRCLFLSHEVVHKLCETSVLEGVLCVLRFKKQLFKLFFLFSLAGKDLGVELSSLLKIFVLQALLPGQVRSPGLATC